MGGWLFHLATVAAGTSWTGRSPTRASEQGGLLFQGGQSGQHRGVLTGHVGLRHATAALALPL
ncbi:hypothetical protein [Nonomuraea sp. NPDC050540]|uniref:hypothetical protein n=1 Tax=Nonomuraea sp. NPDC050540 TaxID=3364367 RepID=UPI0037B03097